MHIAQGTEPLPANLVYVPTPCCAFLGCILEQIRDFFIKARELTFYSSGLLNGCRSSLPECAAIAANTSSRTIPLTARTNEELRYRSGELIDLIRGGTHGSLLSSKIADRVRWVWRGWTPRDGIPGGQTGFHSHFECPISRPQARCARAQCATTPIVGKIATTLATVAVHDEGQI